MRRFPGIAFMLVLLWCIPVLAGQASKSKLSNQDVKDLVAIGLSTEVIVDKIRTAEVTDFDTTVEGLKSLKEANVPNEVIRAMINVPKVSSGSVTTSAPSTSVDQPQSASENGTSPEHDFEHSLKIAEGYVKEQRWGDAVAAFRTAYQLKPQTNILNRLGLAYLALGMGTEADDVYNKVLQQNRDIELYLRHDHGWGGPCYGYLVIGPDHLSWVSRASWNKYITVDPDSKENFEVKWSEVRKVEPFGSLEFRVEVKGKKFRFEYMLYGAVQYPTNLANEVVYTESELQNVAKANAVILSLLNTSRSRPPSLPEPQTQSELAPAGDARKP